MSDMKKITGCKPCGNQVLIELLTEQEMANTSLIIGNTKRVQAEYQAIVLAVGPQVRNEFFGFNVGDRVVISGMAVPCPDFGPETEREKKLIEPVAIKAVLV
jgi:co-chaperonin GroES (HSP10)